MGGCQPHAGKHLGVREQLWAGEKSGRKFLKKWKAWLLILTAWPIVLAARVYWQYNPGLWPCLLFWALSLADDPLRWSEMRSRRRRIYGIAFIGALGNAIATISNGGYMPVMGLDKVHSLWIPLTDASRLAWLCDVHSGSSKGDMLIGFALLGLLLNWLCEKAGLLVVEPKFDGKRLPGMGIG